MKIIEMGKKEIGEGTNNVVGEGGYFKPFNSQIMENFFWTPKLFQWRVMEKKMRDGFI